MTIANMTIKSIFDQLKEIETAYTNADVLADEADERAEAAYAAYTKGDISYNEYIAFENEFKELVNEKADLYDEAYDLLEGIYAAIDEYDHISGIESLIDTALDSHGIRYVKREKIIR